MTPHSPLKLCVIDPERSITILVKRVLRRTPGFEATQVIVAHDIDRAFDLLHYVPQDLVLIDWNPFVSSRLARRIRGLPGCLDVPLFAVAAGAERKHVIEAADAGIVAYLRRPLTPEAFYAALCEHLPQRAVAAGV